jgi:hypothetical protein
METVKFDAAKVVAIQKLLAKIDRDISKVGTLTKRIVSVCFFDVFVEYSVAL